tara:strand:+ start:1368 stop:1781 length:414 start_codon:yes stop_codon:yes gene_type:complete
MVSKDWYSPAEISFSKDHVVFLLVNSRLLEDGFYPPAPKETGYEELKVLVKRGKPRAYFELPVSLIAEVKIRLSLAGQDGEMLWNKYRLDMDEYELAKLYHCNYTDVVSKLNSALWFVSGWKREKLTYDCWCRIFQY